MTFREMNLCVFRGEPLPHWWSYFTRAWCWVSPTSFPKAAARNPSSACA